MRLTVLGRSPARPNPAEACAGYLVEGGGARLLLDIGPGVVAQLLVHNEPTELDAVVVSHMHPDHMLDLVTLRYAFPWRSLPEDRRLHVIMPPGSADQLVDLARGAGGRGHLEDVFRLSEHDGRSSMAFGGLTLTPVQTQHFIPCWGFRAEADDRTLAYTADTAPCDALMDLATDADLLLSEATLRALEEDAAPPDPRGHLLPAEAGDAARGAGARRLLLTHLPVDDTAWTRGEAARAYGGDVEIAEPARTYEV